MLTSNLVNSTLSTVILSRLLIQAYSEGFLSSNSLILAKSTISYAKRGNLLKTARKGAELRK
jgi:hypothetical protein